MPKKNGGALTEQQKLFCREYLVDRCATAAAIRAGYSKRQAPTPTSLPHDEVHQDQAPYRAA